MTTSYPPRLYEDGKSPLQITSMNHYCYLAKLKTMKNYIGEDVWDELKNSSVGVFLKLVDIEQTKRYIWSSQIVHFFLTNQLAVNNMHEFWSLIDGQPLRFSLHEFKDITGLNCGPYSLDDSLQKKMDDYEEFWEAMEVPCGDGPTWEELLRVLKRCESWHKDKRMMIGRLCILHVGIYGINHASRIPMSSARKVIDEENFDKYPWGREAFTSLVNSVKVVKFKGNCYQLHGCVHVLLIWLFEYVPALGELYGFKRNMDDVPPLLNWRGSRQRFRFEDLIREEKAKHGQVCQTFLHIVIADLFLVIADLLFSYRRFIK